MYADVYLFVVYISFFFISADCQCFIWYTHISIPPEGRVTSEASRGCRVTAKCLIMLITQFVTSRSLQPEAGLIWASVECSKRRLQLPPPPLLLLLQYRMFSVQELI